ncbi:MAG TPA: hypothetical protein VN948_16635 [Terriglobales bacterium]|nr:hypothetical protein [Terriglobales bacterium]
MHTLVIEAVPPGTLRSLPIAREILLAVVIEHVMLTRQRVEFARLRELTQITGMNKEIRRVRHDIDLVDRRLQSSGDVRICWLVKTNVTAADLDKAEVRTLAGVLAAAFGELEV